MPKIKLDHLGIGQVLSSAPVQMEVSAAAASVAAKVNERAKDGTPIPVKTYNYRARLRRDTIPRAAAAVVMAHPAGLPIEAKRSPLTRAASASGLQLGKKGRR
jgi:hypothetical protein